MWISGNPTTKSASEMENHFFEKSNDKVCLNSYSTSYFKIGMVKRFLICFKQSITGRIFESSCSIASTYKTIK